MWPWGDTDMIEPKAVLVKLHNQGWTVIKDNEHDPNTGRVTSRGTVTGYGENDWKKYAEPGIPVVNIRTIPKDKLLKWALQSPLIDPDLKGVRGVKVEQNRGDFGEPEKQLLQYMHPTYKAIGLLGNLQKVSVEEYCILAREWGATVTQVE